MHPEVTAVITTHARPASVLEALASVRAEVHEDLEVVVVDDGGSFVAPFDDVRVIRGTNLGVAGARNLGLEAARGEFVIYLDDDDVALPNRVSSLLSAARRHEVSLCFGMTRRIAVDAAAMRGNVPTHLVASGPIGFGDLLTCNPHVNAVLVRTAALRAIGGFDAGIEHFDDWAAWLRIADREPMLWQIADAVAEWRVHSFGLSGSVLRAGAMKRRLLSLFEHLRGSLSARNGRALATARAVVGWSDIFTYDDYVDAMVRARAQGRRRARYAAMNANA